MTIWKCENVKKVVYILLIFVLAGLFAGQGRAQDPQMSQFYAAPLYLSPSLAGSTDGSRAVANYRNQWPAIPKAFVTYMFSFDHYFYRVKSGAGFLFSRDQAGAGRLGTTNIGLQYSYRIRINKDWEVRPGLQCYFSQRSIDISKLTFFDQLSTGQSSSVEEINYLKRTGYLDFTASALVFSYKNWMGLTIDHLTEPNESLREDMSRIPRKYTVFGGTKIPLNQRLGKYGEEALTLSFLYKAQGKYDQLDIGAYWSKSPLTLGLWYRGIPGLKAYEPGYQNNDAVMIMIGYGLEDLKVGYSYDLTISRLATSSGGSHEISVIYEFWQEQKVRKRRKHLIVPCPKL